MLGGWPHKAVVYASGAGFEGRGENGKGEGCATVVHYRCEPSIPCAAHTRPPPPPVPARYNEMDADGTGHVDVEKVPGFLHVAAAPSLRAGRFPHLLHCMQTLISLLARSK
jgi:hypothetical protein